MEIDCNCLWSRWRARPTVVCMALTWMMWVWFRDAYGHQTTRGLWISQQQITTLRLASLYSCHIRARPGVNLAMPLSSARHSAVDQFFPCNNIAFLCLCQQHHCSAHRCVFARIFLSNVIQFPKINIVPLVKSTMEMRSIWQGKTQPQNNTSLLNFGILF